MLVSFPPPDATYSEIRAWMRKTTRAGEARRDWPKCAACGKRARMQPLAVRTRIRYSAKHKDTVFEPGQVLCAGHQTESVV